MTFLNKGFAMACLTVIHSHVNVTKAAFRIVVLLATYLVLNSASAQHAGSLEYDSESWQKHAAVIRSNISQLGRALDSQKRIEFEELPALVSSNNLMAIACVNFDFNMTRDGKVLNPIPVTKTPDHHYYFLLNFRHKGRFTYGQILMEYKLEPEEIAY